MDAIPITFERGGKKYSGSFCQVQGAGSTAVWHLYSDERYFLGRLRQSNDEWFFDDSNSKLELKYLSRFFGNYIHERT